MADVKCLWNPKESIDIFCCVMTFRGRQSTWMYILEVRGPVFFTFASLPIFVSVCRPVWLSLYVCVCVWCLFPPVFKWSVRLCACLKACVPVNKICLICLRFLTPPQAPSLVCLCSSLGTGVVLHSWEHAEWLQYRPQRVFLVSYCLSVLGIVPVSAEYERHLEERCRPWRTRNKTTCLWVRPFTVAKEFWVQDQLFPVRRTC